MYIRTDRLILREFKESDWVDVLAYQSHPDYLMYYPWSERTEDAVQEFIQIFVEWQTEQPRTKFQFAIIHQDMDRLIGSAGIRKKTCDAVQGDLGYELSPDFWGHGYATEAAGELLRFGFDDLELHRVWSRCIADNARSARVLERLGMKLEGRLRENEWFKERWWDTLIYSMLDYEWYTLHENQDLSILG